MYFDALSQYLDFGFREGHSLAVGCKSLYRATNWIKATSSFLCQMVLCFLQSQSCFGDCGERLIPLSLVRIDGGFFWLFHEPVWNVSYPGYLVLFHFPHELSCQDRNNTLPPGTKQHEHQKSINSLQFWSKTAQRTTKWQQNGNCDMKKALVNMKTRKESDQLWIDATMLVKTTFENSTRVHENNGWRHFLKNFKMIIAPRKLEYIRVHFEYYCSLILREEI